MPEGSDPRVVLVDHVVTLAASIQIDGQALPVELRPLPAGGAGEPPDIEVKGTYDGYGVQFWNFKEPFGKPVKTLAGTADRWWHQRDGIFMAWGAGVTAPAEDQFKYGCLIVGLAVTYKSIQGILDYLKDRSNGEQK